jgi:hypothetical protein
VEKQLIKHNSKVTDDGIYVPVYDYQYDSEKPLYKLLISKEVFIEAYNRWIKEGGHDGTI